jgi:PEP-CTERM motif
MSSRRAMLFPLLVAVNLIVGIRRTSIAQNPGDPVTVQFGSYLSPTAEHGAVPFTLSYNCYSFTTPPYQGCDVETREYSAAVFASFLGGQAIQINSYAFFSASASLGHASIIPNIYDVYMGVAGGPLSFFGTFGGGNPVCGTQCSMTCNTAPSVTCMPEGSGGVGSYLYDPGLGNLQVKMVEKLDMAVGDPFPYWYDNGELVTRFDGTVVATPEPSTIVLVGSGFVAVLGFARRRRRPMVRVAG